MGYSRDIYDSAMNELARRRRQAEQTHRQRRDGLYEACPRLRDIDRDLSHTYARAAQAVLHGSTAKEELTRIRDRNQSMQREKAQLIRDLGFEANYLKVPYTCPDCSDTGYIDGAMCHCLRTLMRKEAYRRLNETTPLALSAFDQFDLSYYDDTSENGGPSPRQVMARIVGLCRSYADSFSLESDSLLFTGRTGLGKTHLSLAIANEVIEKGFGVVYGSAQNFASSLEKERFSRDENDTNHLLLSCDLLIMDDLGTEFTTSFVTASLYNVINTRLMAEKPTLINTNLSMKELTKRYGERFCSRIIGGYTLLTFAGRDVRQLKRIRRMEQKKNNVPMP